MAFENLCMYCFEETNGSEICPHCGRDSRTAVPQVQLLPGTQIYAGGRFLVGRALGQDVNGVVYTALDTRLNRKLRIREYFPREYASRLADGSVVPAAGEEDNFDAGLKRVKASVQNAQDPANRHFFFEENGTGYIVQRKSAAAAAAVRDEDPEPFEDEEESTGPNVKVIIGIVAAVLLVVGIIVFAAVNMLNNALDNTGIQDVTKEDQWQPLELPSPTPYVAATIGDNIDYDGDDWKNQASGVDGGGVVQTVTQAPDNGSSQQTVITVTPTPYAGLTANTTISSKSSKQEIKDLQIVLVQQGWLQAKDITGVYDKTTKNAVKEFQSFMNKNYNLSEKLTVDGIAGRKTLYCLLQTEYSRNPQTVTAAPTAKTTPAPTEENPIILDEKTGTKDEIRAAQRMLIALKLLDPSAMTGKYDAATRNAVLAFQVKVNDLFGRTILETTGTIDATTGDYLKLYAEKYGSVTPAPEVTPTPVVTEAPVTDAPTAVPTELPIITAEPDPDMPAETEAPAIETAEPGETVDPNPTEYAEPEGEDDQDGIDETSDEDSIIALQSLLAKYGFLTEEDVDGKFGKRTTQAIENFQRFINAKGGDLTENGVADSNTLEKLFEMDDMGMQSTVDANASSSEVSRVQQYLIDLKWLNIEKPTGKFGAKTTQALTDFQTYINEQSGATVKLQVTGIADPLTQQYLAMKSDKVVNPAARATEAPIATEEPAVTEEPVYTEAPIATEEPVVTEEPIVTEEPVVTEEPIVTEEPVVTEKPKEESGIGEKSDEENIRSLQTELASFGFLNPSDVDGDYGKRTKNAVKAFQTFVNLYANKDVLKVTGNADESTLDWILRMEDELTYGVINAENQNGTAMVQDRLVTLGWMLPEDATGTYDEITKEAVTAFQTYLNSQNPPLAVAVTGNSDIVTQQYLLLDKLKNPNPVQPAAQQDTEEEDVNPNQGPEHETAVTEAPVPEVTTESIEIVTAEPTEEPTPEPTEEPTLEPTEEPTPEPTEEPTPEPTEEPTPEPNNDNPTVSAGSSQAYIDKLQNRLVEMGYMAEASGSFDWDTVQAVATFQMEYNEAMGAEILTVIDPEDPNAVVDYETLCAMFGIQ